MAKSKKNNTVETITQLAEPLCEKLGLDLWDVRFEKEGSLWYLRVFIDKDEGINIDDCEAFAQPFNKILDENDPISEQYIFECSSPGIARQLRKPEHFQKFIGSLIRVRLIRPYEGQSEFICTLSDYDETEKQIVCQTEEDENGEATQIIFDFKEVAFVKLYDDKDLF